MARSFRLSPDLASQGWKLKIRDKERVEPPHVSIIRGKLTWRWGLREQTFLDKKPPPRRVPKELQEELDKLLEDIKKQWDKMYQENPVESGGNK